MYRKFGFTLIALLLAASFGWWFSQREKANQPVGQHPSLEPWRADILGDDLLVQWLVGKDSSQESFFQCLNQLRMNQGIPTDFREQYWRDGQAARVESDDQVYVVAIVHGIDPFIPGHDFQQLILFDNRGRFLDLFTCAMSNRLTSFFVDHSGKFLADMPANAEDGAHLVLRYVPPRGERVAGNW
jgi:hypothetical protein